MATGTECAQLEALADVGPDLAHHHRSQPGALAIGRGRDRLHIARPKRSAADVELALHDRGVGDDVPVDLQEEVLTPDGVLPIVLREPLLVVRPECGDEQSADRFDLRCCQVVRSDSSQPYATGVFRHGEPYRLTLWCGTTRTHHQVIGWMSRCWGQDLPASAGTHGAGCSRRRSGGTPDVDLWRRLASPTSASLTTSWASGCCWTRRLTSSTPSCDRRGDMVAPR